MVGSLVWYLPGRNVPYAVKPDPEMSPYEVVRTQMEALSHNDFPDPDFGIEVIYNFLAPDHDLQAAILEDVVTLWHNPVYSDMLNLISYTVEEHYVREDEAVFFVFLESKDEEKYMYIFELSRQEGGPMEGVWLTRDVRLYDKVAKPGPVEIQI